MGCIVFINPLRACAGGLQYLSCVSVRLSITMPAATSLVFTQKVRYVGLNYRFKIHGLLPSLQKLWREKANMQMSSSNR